MRLVKTIFIFILGVLVGSFFPSQSKEYLAKARDRIFTRERKVEVEVVETGKVKTKPAVQKVVQKAPSVRTIKRPSAQIYTVQVASFKNVQQANGMVNKLIQEEYNAYIAPVDLEKKNGWYRVCIGESTTAEQAKQHFATLKPRFKDSFIQAF